jgi:hypothetical protein
MRSDGKYGSKILLKVIVAFFLMITQGCTINSVNTINSAEELIKELSKAKNGSHIFISQGSYTLNSSIRIPDGVTLEGVGHVIFKSQTNIGSFFRLDNTKGVTLKNISLFLDYKNRGLYSKKDSNVSNLKVENLIFKGNLHWQKSKSRTSGKAIYITNANGVSVKNSKFENVFGGIYVLGDNIEITDNYLFSVNFGNIVLSGSDIRIINNYVKESGKGSTHHHPSGDSITIGGGSENILIKGNTLDTGYCYMLLAHGPLTNLNISDNVVKSGVTTGFMIEGVKHAIIENNRFDSNLANGLAIMKGGEDVVIRGNIFTNNPVLVSSDVKNVSVNNNSFLNISEGSNPIRAKDNVSKNGNKIMFIPRENKPRIEVFHKSKVIPLGSDYIVSLAEARELTAFTIKNAGNKLLKLYGFPQIIITGDVLPKKTRTHVKSGDSSYSGFSVLSRNQPRYLTVKPLDEIEFYITNEAKGINKSTEVIINIPNSSTYPEVYWFKLIIKAG